MRYIVNSKNMKDIDRYSIDTIGIPSMVLMERAAFCVAQRIIENEATDSKIISLCGIGNNGGDGIATARILNEKGYSVCIYLLGDILKASKETQEQYNIAINSGVIFKNKIDISEYNVIIDAIFGIGLSRDVEGSFAQIINEVNKTVNKKVYAIDIPSGISADSGKVMGVAVNADYTVTFGLNKIGIIMYPGADYSGKVYVEDIGFANEAIKHVIEETDIKYYSVCYKNTSEAFPKRINNSNKGTYGKILVIAGSKNMAGAAYFSSKAAYKAGAGLVKIFTCEDNRTILQSKIPEAILETYSDDEDRIVAQLAKAVNWADVIVIGPGMGTGLISYEIVKNTMLLADVPVIVDADAINIITEHEEIELCDNAILTPHLKELSRLLKRDVNRIIDNREESAIMLPDIYNEMQKKVVMVMKDARTIITDGKDFYVNTSGNNALSTAGSGDVLTGIIASFVANGQNLVESVVNAVFIHGATADRYIIDKNKHSMMAEDIINMIDYL